MGNKELLHTLKEQLLTPTTEVPSNVSAVSVVSKSLMAYTPEARAEITQWISFARTLSSSKISIDLKLATLNSYLQSRSVLVGKGLNITVADLAIFVAVRDLVANLSSMEQGQLANLLRWFDYIQHQSEVHPVYEEIPIKKPDFHPPNVAGLRVSVVKPSGGTDINGVPKCSLDARSVERGSDIHNESAGNNADKKVNGPQVISQKLEKTSKEKAQSQPKDTDCSITVLDIRVGIIEKVWKHPGADGLYVEDIDIGEPNVRQVVSGLAKFVKEDQLMKKKVLVLVNVKPGKVRDVLSSGLVLCASNADHSICEPLAPPEDSPIGEKIRFQGFDGAPEEVLNPKKKQLEKLLPDLRTNELGIATFKGIPFMTSKGPCISTVPNATIK